MSEDKKDDTKKKTPDDYSGYDEGVLAEFAHTEKKKNKPN